MNRVCSYLLVSFHPGEKLRFGKHTVKSSSHVGEEVGGIQGYSHTGSPEVVVLHRGGEREVVGNQTVFVDLMRLGWVSIGGIRVWRRRYAGV
jgi:hypothetical protein